MPSDQRQTKLAIELGGEEVELVRFDGMESLSQHFVYSLDFKSVNEIDLLPHLGKPVTVTVCEDGHHLRYFNGISVAAELLNELMNNEGASLGFVYRMTLRPAAYLHSQGRDFKIFQNQTTDQIIDKILGQCGIKAAWEKSAARPLRAYCVQYGESNFGFVSRLMEEEGLYYFYKHEEAAHILTICDSPVSHKEGAASPMKHNVVSGSAGNVDSKSAYAMHDMYVQAWHERVSTGGERKVSFRDFDFMEPKAARKAESTNENSIGSDVIEFYDFPGRFFDEGTGNERAKALLQARLANRRTYGGESRNAAIECGTTFELRDHKQARFNKNYLITHCHHSISTEQHMAGMDEASGTLVHFEAVLADTKWRAPLTARRPVVMGPETAIVTGPKSETIYTDRFGRIKVKFHWDRENPGDECSSCWIRVSQTGGLGNIILPRVGHEVLVDFMSGDPDRPIIVGRVFNEAHKPVYTLPDHKTKALWRTLTYGDSKVDDKGKPVEAKEKLDTASPRCNELRFEDLSGMEEFFMHAQKDMNLRTIYNQTNHIGNDQDVKIGQHRTMKIGVDDTAKIGNNRDTDIESNEKRHVGNNRDTKIDTNETLNVGQMIKIDAGTDIMITAGSKITLKVGGSTITMDSNKIEVKTKQLMMDGSATTELSGGMTTVKASGVTTIQGSMVKIN